MRFNGEVCLSRSTLIASLVFILSGAGASGQGSIAGTVYDSLRTHAPLANATVVLLERSRFATTDAAGRFRIDSVPDGRYTLGFSHDVLDSLGLEAPVIAVDIVGGRQRSVSLATPSVATVYHTLCPGPGAPDLSLIFGRVRDVDDGSPLAGAVVSTDWSEFTLRAGSSANHRVRAAARTDGRGAYVLCGVPDGVPLEVSAAVAEASAGPRPLTLENGVLQRVDVAISRRDAGARGTATVRGVVHGADGRPVRDAVVRVLGTSDSVRADAAGAFMLDHVPAGTRTVEVRSIGMIPATTSLDLPTNGNRTIMMSITRKAQELTAVTIAGRARSASWMEVSGFETRRLHGLGAYLTEEEIGRHAYPDLAAVLRGMRGVHVECNATRTGLQGMPCFPMPTMLGISDFSNGVYCAPNYFVDGVPFRVDAAGPGGANPFSDLSAIVPPNRIKGIEVYSSPGAIPAQYDLTSSTGCGSVVIWTH